MNLWRSSWDYRPAPLQPVPSGSGFSGHDTNEHSQEGKPLPIGCTFRCVILVHCQSHWQEPNFQEPKKDLSLSFPEGKELNIYIQHSPRICCPWQPTNQSTNQPTGRRMQAPRVGAKRLAQEGDQRRALVRGQPARGCRDFAPGTNPKKWSLCSTGHF